jgi:hypothetical protein
VITAISNRPTKEITMGKWVPSKEDASSRRVTAALAAQAAAAAKAAQAEKDRQAALARQAKKGTGVKR